MQQNKTTLVQLPLTTLSQETRWVYSTTPPSPHRKTQITKPRLNKHTHTKPGNINIKMQKLRTSLCLCVNSCAQISYLAHHGEVLIIFLLSLQTIIIPRRSLLEQELYIRV